MWNVADEGKYHGLAKNENANLIAVQKILGTRVKHTGPVWDPKTAKPPKKYVPDAPSAPKSPAPMAKPVKPVAAAPAAKAPAAPAKAAASAASGGGFDFMKGIQNMWNNS